ncbi:EVE domain-containing protein [Vitiosangium sp. GDMCC 1.1324]|uniref:EVE domain-containing protein n=1 Tax=Vitiosangium sp. (strain GDMCC 1.1324) TaxID=2138576 RepID=UPI000D3AA46B|nr:EVE domain-containing protein [Vitiosangium sp. GDMCC 1.1324]PTL84594.1 EVE domain-containing protein [Vitiosangium sp. GDMCC 1.1324]
MRKPRYWVAVASCDHVRKGVEGGFGQACHGKAAPLRRMAPGDWVLYYSPRLRFEGEEPCQAFTAIGRVVDAPVEQDMGGGFNPFRRAIAFLPCREVPIRPLLGRLSFIQDVQRWGYIFRRGHFELPEADFQLLSREMLGGEQLPAPV